MRYFYSKIITWGLPIIVLPKGNKEIYEILILPHEKCILGEIISVNIMALSSLVTRSAGITQPKPTKPLNLELDTCTGSFKIFPSSGIYMKHPHPVCLANVNRVKELICESGKKLIHLP